MSEGLAIFNADGSLAFNTDTTAFVLLDVFSLADNQAAGSITYDLTGLPNPVLTVNQAFHASIGSLTNHMANITITYQQFSSINGNGWYHGIVSWDQQPVGSTVYVFVT